VASETCYTVLVVFACLGLIAQPAGLAAESVRARPTSAGKSKHDTPRQAAAAPRGGAKTLREAAEEIGRRHGVRIVIDDAVRADVPAPAVPDGNLEGMLLEATLRGLLAGNELMFHYGADRPNGGERLKAVWVFSHSQGSAVRATATAGTGSGVAGASAEPGQRAAALDRLASPAPAEVHVTSNHGLQDSDENVRLQALHSELANTSPPDLRELRRLVEEDASEAVRIQALEAYITHPDATEEDVGTMLDRIADDAQQILGDYARSLREARAAAPADTALIPEPIEESQ
jgi:hypothetical protein